MRILITGAEGFVASNLIPQLAKEQQVVGLDFLTSRKKSNLPRNIPFLNEDLSKVDVSKLPIVDLIVHLAVISIERVNESNSYEQINASSLLKILELAKRDDASLILASSGSVYGNGLNFKEASPFNPLSLYSVGKINAERYVNFYHRKYGLNVTILRYSNCFGDLTYLNNKFYPGKKDVMRIFMEKALRDEPLPVIGGQIRDFTFIDDVVDATRSVIDLNGFNIFNIATGIETRIEDIPPMIGRALSKKVKTQFIPPRSIDNLMQRSLNINKISQFWKPKYSLEEGIELYARRMR